MRSDSMGGRQHRAQAADGKATNGGKVAGTMEQARARQTRVGQHADRLGRWALRNAGPLRAVASAIRKEKSTVGHYVTDKVHPTLRPALGVLLNLLGNPGVNGRACVDAFNEALELSDIILEETPRLIERGLFLMRWENELGFREDVASLSGCGHSEALRRVASASNELAQIIDELQYRGVDLHELYRVHAAEQEGVRVGA